MHLRYLIEYWALRFGLFLLRRLSLSQAERLAVGIANLWYLLNASRRRVAQDNIRRAGISQDPAVVDRIARESFRHFAVLAVESVKSDEFFDETNWRARVELEIAPATLAILNDPGKGVILVSGHLGNWEVAAQLLSYLKPVVGVTKKMSNPYTDRLIKERKPRNRFRLTPMREAGADRFLSALKNGEMLALLVDQYAKGERLMVDFFGVPASTHPSPAILHLVTKTPLCFGYCLRTGPMKYRLVAGDPIAFARTGNRESDVRSILEILNRQLEAAIRLAPEQYLWAHRRWRDKPAPAAPPTRAAN
jgi:KDO2-lipid IV(A) lauroyltransferase